MRENKKRPVVEWGPHTSDQTGLPGIVPHFPTASPPRPEAPAGSASLKLFNWCSRTKRVLNYLYTVKKQTGLFSKRSQLLYSNP